MSHVLLDAGLGVEMADFRTSELPLQAATAVNRLRPEAVESFFYLWKATGNAEYRDWGWEAFQAFQNYSRTTEGAYSSTWVSMDPCSCKKSAYCCPR